MQQLWMVKLYAVISANDQISLRKMFFLERLPAISPTPASRMRLEATEMVGKREDAEDVELGLWCMKNIFNIESLHLGFKFFSSLW